MLARIRKTHEENEGGFTLIELLVVVIIIGILAAIAIPTFLSQREKAWKKAAQSDLRNAATKMEEYFDDNGNYNTATAALFKSSGDDAGNSNVTLTIDATTTATTYCLEADHTKLALNPDFHLDVADGRPMPGAC